MPARDSALLMYAFVLKENRLAVIFKGQGKIISEAEKQVWDKDIDVYFQSKAWADTKYCVDWVNHTLKPLAGKESHFVLFCDNLEGQIADRFKEALPDIGGIV